MPPPIGAFVADDSAAVRRRLADVRSASGIEVLGTAGDPLLAWRKLQARGPDVEMPRMDGISFLRKRMAEQPTPSSKRCGDAACAGAGSSPARAPGIKGPGRREGASHRACPSVGAPSRRYPGDR